MRIKIKSNDGYMAEGSWEAAGGSRLTTIERNIGVILGKAGLAAGRAWRVETFGPDGHDWDGKGTWGGNYDTGTFIATKKCR